MTSVEKYYWYKEHEKEIEAFFIECFKKWFEEYISKLPDIKDVGFQYFEQVNNYETNKKCTNKNQFTNGFSIGVDSSRY